jgi:hypothetical protein
MKYCVLVCAFGLLASAGFAGLSGTYTIKPDSTGDFPDFQSAANALVDSGISGDCMFEAYTGHYTYEVDLHDVSGTDSWSITFCNAAGEHPVVADEAFNCSGLNRLTLENLTFEHARPSFSACQDCRISNCRFTPVGDFLFQHCSLFVITGNVVRSLCETTGTLLDDCPDFTIANNFLSLSTPSRAGSAMSVGSAPGLRLYFNTLWCPSIDANWVSCLGLYGDFRADIRNNVFFLARGCDMFSSCIQNEALNRDTFDFDYNCYFVDSVGFVGSWRDTFVGFAGWQAVGYDSHGRYGDPLFVDTSNLHLRQGSPCIGAGVPIAGYESDIDGEPRDPVHPDIGADEFMGSAVEERYKPHATSFKLRATVIRRVPASSVTFDAMGRRVVDPRSGIYFVRERPAVGGQPSAVSKVVITR